MLSAAMTPVMAFGAGFALGIISLIILFKAHNVKGTMSAAQDEEGAITYTLELEEEPEDLMKKRYVIFKIIRKSQ